MSNNSNNSSNAPATAVTSSNGGSQEQGREHDGDACQAIFPQRLMSILSDCNTSDSICWLPHGRAFIIRNRKLFAETIMPKFFPRKSKYSSFTRKLNRWDFQRVSSGPELGAYYHEFFLRDKPQLAAQMFCKNQRTKMAMSTPTVSPASINAGTVSMSIAGASGSESMMMAAVAKRDSLSSSASATLNAAGMVPSGVASSATVAANSAAPTTTNNNNSMSSPLTANINNTNPLFQEHKFLDQKLGGLSSAASAGAFPSAAAPSSSVDVTQLLLAGQGMDRQTRMLVERQLLFMKQQQQLEQLKQFELQQQQQQQQQAGNNAHAASVVQSQLISLLANEKKMDLANLLGSRMDMSAPLPPPAATSNPFLPTAAAASAMAATLPRGGGLSAHNFDPVALQHQMQEIQAHKQEQARILQFQQLINLQRQRRSANRKSNNFRASAA